MKLKLYFNQLKYSKGVMLMELLIALAIGTTILVALSSGLASSQQSLWRSSQNQQAELNLQEISEAARSLAQTSFNSLNTNGIYHPVVSTSDWTLVPGEETIGNYKRKLVISDAYRDDQGNLAETGTVDPAIKKITATISWSYPWSSAISQTFYLARWLDNAVWKEDTFEDFSDGVENASDFTTNPGFVQIAQTGGGGWTQPKSIGTVDCLAKAAGITANSTHIYLCLDRTWGNVEVFDIAGHPEAPVSQGSFDTLYRTNDAAINGNYLYLADDLFILPSVSIYNLATNPLQPAYVGSAGVFYQAQGIWATNDYLFVSAKNSRYVLVYSLGSHPTQPSWVGLFSASANVIDLTVSGRYLYIALDRISPAVQIMDIGINPANPTQVGQFNTLYKPTGIAADGNILYLSLDQKRGAMYSLTNPVNPFLYGYFPTVRNNVDVIVYGDYGYVAGTDSQLKAIEVFDLADSKGISGIYFVYGDYLSSTFDASSAVAFNRLSWVGTKPALTDIMFQVAVNNDNQTWNFVGPDGTSGTYYEAANSFPLNNVLGRYLKYKIILTGDGDSTPVVDSVTINYSP